jgi:ATP/ADP translocase
MTSTALQVSRYVVPHLPLLTRRALLIGRGGAAVMAATAVTANSSETLLGVNIAPEAKSVLFMALAMACHYLGYSLARPITVSLFTSASTGYKGAAWAFPFAMAFVSPAALFMLMGYTRVLEKSGPRKALTSSTLFCAVVLCLSALTIGIADEKQLMLGGVAVAKLISGPLFVFRESYVQLLTSQYWSFMASVLTPNQSAKWFGPIAGITSIASAAAGMCVKPLVQNFGLAGSLMGTGFMLVVSLLWASYSYALAEKYNFAPTDVRKKKELHIRKKKGTFVNHHKKNMFEKASNLFARVPVLRSLFVEILASQGLATVLNVIFVSRLATAITDDSERAGWVGMYFSLINVITMVLQFAILPPLMSVIEPRTLWRLVPSVTFGYTAFQAMQKDPTLYVVAASLLVMKVSEYSARRLLDEMVFVPLDFESRFLGKEVIGVFGYRFGKSLMSLIVSGISSLAPSGKFGLQEQSMFGTLVALSWMQTAWSLSNQVPTRAEAQAAYNKEKGNVKTRQ